MPQEQWIERLVRYQCLEPVLAGRRVLEIGCGTGRGAEHLAQLALEVEALDTSSLVLAEARRHHVRANLEFHVAEPDKLDFENDSFDVVLVPELQRWFARGALIPELKRVLRHSGVAVFAVPSADAGEADGLAYSDFIEYLAQGFHHVRLLGEIPFRGTIMADFEPDEALDPELDCSLLDEDEAPRAYLALCSDGVVDPVSYTVVQVPGSTAEPGELARLQSELDRARQQLRQTEVRADEWAQKVETISSQQMAQAEKLEAANVRVQQREAELKLTLGADHDGDVELVIAHAKLRDERDALAARVDELERFERSEASDDVEELRDQLAEAERRVLEASTRARAELTTARRELREQQDAATRASDELAAVRAALEEARALLAERRPLAAEDADLEALRAELEATSEELQQTVEASRARIAELEVDLARARRSHDGGAAAPAAAEGELVPLRRWVESLSRQLEAERERADGERERADAAASELAEQRARVEVEKARSSAAEQAVVEQKQRALGAEKRCDGLVARIEHGAVELSKLHQRIAEQQALRQSERWRIDELTGRLRECQSQLVAKKREDAAVDEFRSEPTRRDPDDLERQVQLLEKARSEAEVRAKHADERAKHAQERAAQVEAAAAAESQVGRVHSATETGEASADSSAAAGVTVALRGDLGRAQARIDMLEKRCDELLAEAQRAALAAQDAERQLAQAEPQLVDAKLVDQVAELRARAARVEALENQLSAAAEQQAQQIEKVERRLEATERARVLLEQELGVLRRDAALGTALGGSVEGAIEVPSAAGPGDANPGDGDEGWSGAELLRVRERQLDALLEGAARHQDETRRATRRLDDLEGLAGELRLERDAIEKRLLAAEKRVRAEQGRAESYRLELTEQGRQLALVQGELLRHRGRADQPS